MKVDATALNGSVDYTLAEFQSAVAESTGTLSPGPTAFYTVAPTLQRELSFDATVSGSADWWGRREQVAFGVDYTHFHQDLLLDGDGVTLGPTTADAYDFNPALYPNPRSLPGPGYASGQMSGTVQTGVWASALIQITAPWSVTIGLRMSDETGSNSSVVQVRGYTLVLPGSAYTYVDKATPYVGTMFALTGHYSLYASYADIYDSNSGDVSISKRLSPADGINIEAGIKGSWRDGALTSSLALYSTVQRGLASSDIDQALTNPNQPYCCFYPDGRNKSKGVDLEFEGSILPGWLVAAGYTFNNNEELIPDAVFGGALSTQTPRHLLKVWTSRQFWRRWSVGTTLQFQSRNYASGLWCPALNSRGDCSSNYLHFNDAQSSYAIVSPRIGYQLGSKWQIAVSVNNLFDKTYYQTVSAPLGGNWYGDPRNFVVRLDGKF